MQYLCLSLTFLTMEHHPTTSLKSMTGTLLVAPPKKWLLDLSLALECEGRSFWEIFQNAFPSSSMVALSTSPVCLQNRLHQKKLRFCKICCWQPHTWKPLTMNNPTSWQTYSVTNLLSFPSLRCCNLNVAQKKNMPGQKQVLDFYSDEVSFSNEF